MRNYFSRTAAGCALAIIGLAQAASAQGRGPAPLAIPNPTYVSIPMEIMVNRPAAEVWKRIGKYCDIGEWARIPCTIISGKDGEFGAVRSVGNEILVGKTELSYTYTQPVREGQPYILYHGTLEARPVTATTSKIIYTLMYRQLDAGGRRRARGRQNAKNRPVHAVCREHEDPGRRRHAAARPGSRRRAKGRSAQAVS